VPCFDTVVVVDWSANAVPKRGRDSIWSCLLDAATGDVQVLNHPTRRCARDHLVQLLLARQQQRVLVGIDVPYGYPPGFARAAGTEGRRRGGRRGPGSRVRCTTTSATATTGSRWRAS